MSWEMYRALRPMLAVGGGDLWMMSTPAGKSGFFYETWARGGPEWERITAKATECERISASYLEDELETMGEESFAQEYMCEFTEYGDHVFDAELLEAALDDTFQPLFHRSPWEQ